MAFGARRPTISGAGWAALAVAACTVSTAAGSQETSTGQAARLALQKARMLETFLASDRVAAAKATDPGTVSALLAEARTALAAGREALERDRAAEAGAAFDDGLAALSRAAALAVPDRGEAPPDAAAHAERRAQVQSYVDALDRARTLSAGEAARLEAIRAELARADAHAGEGRPAEARRALDAAYGAVVALVAAVQEGRTHFVSRTFETAAEALAYERDRHDSHRLLVGLALAGRVEFQPGLATLAANLGTRSDRLREEADRLAAEGRTAEAVETMQRATDRLLAVLRAAGLVLPE